MIQLRKGIALAGAVALTVGTAAAGALVTAPAALAVAAPGTLNCNTFSNSPSFASSFTATNTFTVSPANVAPGGTVIVTWKTANNNQVNNSPDDFGKGTIQIQVLVALSGAMTGSVVAVTEPGSFPAFDIPSQAELGGWTASTSFTAGATPGAINYSVKQLVLNTGARPGADSDGTTYCSPDTTSYPRKSAPADPTVASTLLAGYTPNWQNASNANPPGWPGYDNALVSQNATEILNTTSNIQTGSTETATPPTTESASPPPTTASSTPKPSTTEPTSDPGDKSKNVDTSPRSKSATVKAYCDVKTAGLNALSEYQFPMTIKVSPGAAPPGDAVDVSVSVNNSPENIGPSTLDVGRYRMEATIGFNGQSQQLLGPKNPSEVPGVVEETDVPKPIFPKSTWPLVAKGTLTLPDDEGQFPITIKDIWFNVLPVTPDQTDTAGLDDIFDQRCNASNSPQASPKAFSAPVVEVESNADAEGSGVDPEEGSGGDAEGVLANTGPAQVLGLALIALLVLQLGAVFTVRAVRATPKGPRHL